MITEHTAPHPAPYISPRPFVGVSLKLYFGLRETRRWLMEVADLGREPGLVPDHADFTVLPAFPALTDARNILACTPVQSGAQDLHWADHGAWTGAVSGPMIAETGARYVEVGHAERRRFFGEGDSTVVTKARAAIRAGLIPLLCVGEERPQDPPAAIKQTLTQVRAVLDNCDISGGLVIAYEPVWAIGADQPASTEHVRTVTDAINSELAQRGVAPHVQLIYGGTAGPGTYTQLVRHGARLDGLFLGRRAHDPANLRDVLREVVGGHPDPGRPSGAPAPLRDIPGAQPGP